MGRHDRARDRVVPRRVRLLQARRRRQRAGIRQDADGSPRTRHMTQPFVVARSHAGADVAFRPSMANRHGLVTGATGTGKTVTLQMLADHFSQIGVPVFVADVKGDLSGLAAAGSSSPKLKERLQRTGIADPEWSADPVVFWAVLGKAGFTQ